MKPTAKSVTLPTGITLRYVEQGDPAGTPVLLLHGFTDSWRSFAPVLQHLPGSLRVVAPSLRGHGDSDRPLSGYEPPDFAGDVIGLMDELGLAEAVIVGHSMGGCIAQRLAIDQPRRVRGLVLMGAFIALRRNAEVMRLWDSVIERLSDPVDPALAREFQQSTLAQPVPRPFLDMVVSESLKVPAFVWREALRGQLDADAAEELRLIEAPTLVLWGDHDSIGSHGEQWALVQGIARSQLAVYAGAGHALHWEEPRRAAADLVRFVDGLSRRERAVAAARMRRGLAVATA